MNKYLKCLLMAIAIIIVSVSLYYIIASGYPYDPEDFTEAYFNSILILKGIIAAGAVISISISSAILLKK